MVSNTEALKLDTCDCFLCNEREVILWRTVNADQSECIIEHDRKGMSVNMSRFHKGVSRPRNMRSQNSSETCRKTKEYSRFNFNSSTKDATQAVNSFEQKEGLKFRN